MNFIEGAWSTAGNILTNFLTQNEWTQIGEVAELNLYPLMDGKKLSVEKALCTNQGLKYEGIFDWNFVIFEVESMKVCTITEYPGLVTIDLKYDESESSVTLSATNKITEVISLTEFWLDELFDILIHSDQMFFLRDCGEVAAAWVTDLLTDGKTKLRLGYYQHCGTEEYNERYENYLIQNPNCIMYPFSDHLKTKNRFLLLNITSFDTINDKLSSSHYKIEKYDFYPNIIIKTDNLEPFPEFAWKNIKIGECFFESIEPCTKCTIAKVDAFSKNADFENKNFYTILKESLKINNVDLEINLNEETEAEPETGSSVVAKLNSCATPNLTIDLKFSNDAESTIKCGDGVFIKMIN